MLTVFFGLVFDGGVLFACTRFWLVGSFQSHRRLLEHLNLFVEDTCAKKVRGLAELHLHQSRHRGRYLQAATPTKIAIGVNRNAAFVKWNIGHGLVRVTAPWRDPWYHFLNRWIWFSNIARLIFKISAALITSAGSCLFGFLTLFWFRILKKSIFLPTFCQGASCTASVAQVYRVMLFGNVCAFCVLLVSAGVWHFWLTFENKQKITTYIQSEVVKSTACQRTYCPWGYSHFSVIGKSHNAGGLYS